MALVKFYFKALELQTWRGYTKEFFLFSYIYNVLLLLLTSNRYSHSTRSLFNVHSCIYSIKLKWKLYNILAANEDWDVTKVLLFQVIIKVTSCQNLTLKSEALEWTHAMEYSCRSLSHPKYCVFHFRKPE